MSEQRRGGENNFFSGKKSELTPDFLWVHREQRGGVVSVASLWNHQMFVTSLGFGVQISVGRQSFLDNSFSSLFKNASCPGEWPRTVCPPGELCAETYQWQLLPSPRTRRAQGGAHPASFSPKCWLTSSRWQRQEWNGALGSLLVKSEQCIQRPGNSPCLREVWPEIALTLVTVAWMGWLGELLWGWWLPTHSLLWLPPPAYWVVGAKSREYKTLGMIVFVSQTFLLEYK